MKRLILAAVGLAALVAVAVPHWVAAAPPTLTSQAVSVSVTADPVTTIWSATATCPTGTVVTGGGYDTFNPANDPQWLVEVSAPNGNGWKAYGFKQAGNNAANSVTLHVYAVCAGVG